MRLPLKSLKMRLVTFVMLFLLLFSAKILAKKTHNIKFNRNFKFLYLSGENEYVKSKRILSLRELQNDVKNNTIPFSQNFKTARDSNFYCLKISFENTDVQDVKIFLIVDEPRIDVLRYTIFENGIIVKNGERTITDSTVKILGNNLRNQIQLTIKPHKIYTLYFQVSNRLTINKLRLPLIILSEFYYPTHLFFEAFFEKIYVGTLCFIIVFMVIIVVLVRKKIYTYYLFYLVGLAFFYICTHFYVAYFSDAATLFKNNWTLLILAYSFMLMGYINFSQEFLSGTTFLNAKYIKGLTGLKFFFILLQIVGLVLIWLNIPIVKLSYLTIFGILPLFLMYIWVFIFKAIQNKHKPVFLFMLSYIPIFFAGFLLEPLAEIGFIGDNVNIIFYISHIIELITLSIAIIFRFRLIEIEKRYFEVEFLKQKKNLLQIELHTQEMERERLAKDLHDDLGGTLTAIRNIIVNKESELLLLKLINKAIVDLRNVSRNLLPSNVKRLGFAKTIEQDINYLQISSKITFNLIYAGTERRIIENERELHVYRIVSELLNNVVKHSEATAVTIQILYYENFVRISIEDNGIGFNKDKSFIGIGSLSIHSRIESLKSKLNIDSNSFGTIIFFDCSYI